MKKIYIIFSAIPILTLHAFSQDYIKKDSIYNMVDSMPVFPGNVHAYIISHTVYPLKDEMDSIEGTVYISFIISKNGEVHSVKLEKGVSNDLDHSALRMVRHMPNWIPGKQKGKAVDVLMHIPVKFTIDREKHIDSAEIARLKKFGPRKGFYVVPYLSGGLGKVETDDQFGIIGGGLGAGGDHFTPEGGLEFGYMLNNHFGALVGAQLQNYIEVLNGYNILTSPTLFYNPPPGEYQVQVNYSFNFLQIPLLLSYVSSRPGRTGLHIEAGFLYGMPLSASETGTITQYLGNSTTTVNAVQKPNLYNYDNGIVINVGVYVPLSDQYSFSVDFYNVYNFSPSIGNGNKDLAVFGNSVYNYFQGEYGEATSFRFDIKLFIRIDKSNTSSLVAE